MSEEPIVTDAAFDWLSPSNFREPSFPLPQKSSRSKSLPWLFGGRESRRLSWVRGRPSSWHFVPEKNFSMKSSECCRNSSVVDQIQARRSSFLALPLHKSCSAPRLLSAEIRNYVTVARHNDDRSEYLSDVDITASETVYSAAPEVSDDGAKHSPRGKNGKRRLQLLGKASLVGANIRRSVFHNNSPTTKAMSRPRKTFPWLFGHYVQVPTAEVSTRSLMKTPTLQRRELGCASQRPGSRHLTKRSQHHGSGQSSQSEPFDTSCLPSRAAAIMIHDLWTDDPQQVALGFRELQALSSQETTTQALKSVGFGTIMGSLRRWHGRVEVQREGLRFLCFDDSSAVVGKPLLINAIRCGAIEAICTAMRNFPADEFLHELGTRATYAMVSMSDPLPALRFLSNPENVTLLHQTVTRFKRNKSVCKNASLAFCSMSQFRNMREKLHKRLVAARNKAVPT